MRTPRVLIAAVLVAVAVIGSPSPAWAHVTIPDPAEQGGFSIVTFSVPNERPDASTIRLEVKLPESHALSFVSVQPKPGWTATTTMRTLDEPVEVFGEEVTEVVDTVTWTGGEVAPGQFDTFALSVGVLPDDVDSLVFPTIQTYSSDEEVAWIEVAAEGEDEPEHPAPVLRLVSPDEGDEGEADDGATSTAPEARQETAEDADDDADDDADGLALAALALAIVATVLASGALLAARRRP